MYRLVNQNTVPPGEFPYVIPQTGFKVHGHTLNQAYDKTRDHLTANGLPVHPNLRAIIEDCVCQKLGYPVCEEEDPIKRFKSTLMLTWEVLKAGTTSLGSWILAGKPMVHQAQADARSEVCVRCPANVSPQGCAPCQLGALANLINSIVGTAKASRTGQLRACSCCGCGLEVKVFIPLEHITKSEPLIPYPDNCWIKKEQNAG
jgi:hypothetical protein